jgi:hypothetical protein
MVWTGRKSHSGLKGHAMKRKTSQKATSEQQFRQWLESTPGSEEKKITMSVPITLMLRDWLMAAHCSKRDKVSIGKSLSDLLTDVDWDPITENPMI